MAELVWLAEPEEPAPASACERRRGLWTNDRRMRQAARMTECSQVPGLAKESDSTCSNRAALAELLRAAFANCSESTEAGIGRRSALSWYDLKWTRLSAGSCRTTSWWQTELN